MVVYAPACERNKVPILRVLTDVFKDSTNVLELGSGSGQHASWFAGHLTHLSWQPSERPVALADLQESLPSYVLEPPLKNLRDPICLDVVVRPWPVSSIDAVFTANTLHMMTADEVEQLIAGAAEVLQSSGLLAIYGPFSYGGKHVSVGNAEFDQGLRSQRNGLAIRDFDVLETLAVDNGFAPARVEYLPANNQLLVWVKQGN